MLIRFILLPFLIFTSFFASAALTTVPLREVWALSVDDSVVVNQTAKTAVGRVMLPNAEGVLFRATATTTGARLVGVAETALTGGKGNPWLTAALATAGLTYEGYQWYKTMHGMESVPWGHCSVGTDGTQADCLAALSASYTSLEYVINGMTLHYGFDFDSFIPQADGTVVIQGYMTYVIDTKGNISKMLVSATFVPDYKLQETSKKDPVTKDAVASELLAALANASSSRDAFGENSQPYPLDNLFTNEDLNIDPTYAPSADITAENLPDYITKYNNGLLQTTDPSKPNYVSPSQYQYIKSQAEQAAATAAGGSTSTNPLQGMEQPITQKQYDESNTKTDEAAANQIKSTDWTGVDTASKGGDGANDALDKMAKGIDPTLPVLLLPDLPKYSACRTIDLSWNGYSAVFPSSSQCIKMEEFKTNLGYFLYLLTAVGIILELLRRVD